MTPDFIAPDPRDDDEAIDTDVPDEDDAETVPGSRVKVYDGLVVDPAGNPHTIGADANGD